MERYCNYVVPQIAAWAGPWPHVFGVLRNTTAAAGGFEETCALQDAQRDPSIEAPRRARTRQRPKAPHRWRLIRFLTAWIPKLET